jgi:hypothetical protein
MQIFVKSCTLPGGYIKDRIQVPKDLEDDLEQLHIKINEIRFNANLVIPIKSPMRLSPEEAAMFGMNE